MFHNTLEKFAFSGRIVLQCVAREVRDESRGLYSKVVSSQ